MKDLKSNVDLAASIDPATYNSDQTGAGVDLRGYDSAMATMQSGVLTDGTHTPKLQDSDDNSIFTDVAVSDLSGAFANLSANSVQRVGYRGGKRFVRVFVSSNGATGAVYGASILRGHPHRAPLA